MVYPNDYINNVFQGNSLDAIKAIPDNSIDMVLTDIPYGEVNRKSNGLRNLDKNDADVVGFDVGVLIKELTRITKGSVYVFCGWSQLAILKNGMADADMTTRVIIWEKTNPSPMNGDFVWLSGIEPCVYGKKPKATFNAHCRNSVLRYSSGHSKVHPTQKNLDLFKELIKISSNAGDLVLDPFMGSGTTPVACKELDRRYIGIDLNPEYVEIAKTRLVDTNYQPELNL